MASFYRYPIEYQDDFQGTISFEALVEPEVEFSVLGGSGAWGPVVDRDRQGTVSSTDVEQLFAIPRASITAGVGGVVTDGGVTLYLPQSVQIQDGVTYDNSVSLGTIGAVAGGAINAGANNLYNTALAVGGDIESFINSIVNSNVSQDLARVAAVRVTENVAPQEIASAVKSATRTVVNPNARTLFRSVPIRAFNFDFNLIASSPREAQEITNIIRFFRTQLYPADIGGTATTQGIYGLKFPNKFEIKMMYKNKQIGSKFLPSYLTSFQATYNQNGGAMHKDGNWNQVNINMSF